MIRQVKFQLMSILIFIGALPVVISFSLVYYMIDYQSKISNQIGFDQVLEEYSQDLKKIAKYDKANVEVYKSKFENVQDLRFVVESNNGVLSRVKTSLFKFYLIFFGAFFLILFFIGSYISKLISTRYSEAYLELQEKTEKEKYLSQFEQISEITKKLNHELKKPLGPIEIWNQNLMESHRADDPKTGEVLEMASKVISEEVATLKTLINSFNEYSSLPEPRMLPLDAKTFLEWTLSKLAEVYTRAEINLEVHALSEVQISADEGILSQVFQNLIENALEANPSRRLEIDIYCAVVSGHLEIDFKNKGKALLDVQDIFENFVSSNLDSGRGLGLSIVKVSMIKHGGDIKAISSADGAHFKMNIPTLREG